MNNIYKYDCDELVSIITPAYNCSAYIAETITSVLNQTYPNWEMIIVDDCSDDDTSKIVQKYLKKDKRILLFSLEYNQGVANARNFALSKAKGRYIAFLDSDDIWLYNKIERQLDFMKNNDIAFSFTQYRKFTKKLEQYGKLISMPQVVDYKCLLKGNVIGCLTVMIDRKVISNLEMIEEHHEDYIAWLSILKQGYKAYGLNEDLARYRISANSISANKYNSAIWTWNIYRNIEKNSIFEAIYYFLHYLFKSLIKHHF